METGTVSKTKVGAWMKFVGQLLVLVSAVAVGDNVDVASLDALIATLKQLLVPLIGGAAAWIVGQLVETIGKRNALGKLIVK